MGHYDEQYEEMYREQDRRRREYYLKETLPIGVRVYGDAMQAFLRVFGDDADAVYKYLRDKEKVKPTDYYLIHPTNPEE